MKIQIKLLCMLVLGLAFSANAQRISEEKITINYNGLPSEPLPKGHQTYSVRIHAEGAVLRDIGLTETGLVAEYFNKYRNLKPLGDGGHFRISVILDPFRLTGEETITSEASKKDKDGKVIKSYTYTKKLSYSSPVTMKVEDMNGTVLIEKIIGSRAEPTVYSFGKNHTTKSALNAAWSKVRSKTLIDLRKKAVNKPLKDFSAEIKAKLDTRDVKERIVLELPKGKKMAEAEAFLAHNTTVSTALASIKATEDLKTVKTTIQPSIDFWKNKLADYSPTDKKTRKVHHALLYNLASTAYALDNFGDAETFAVQCINTVDWKKNLPETLLKKVVTQRNLMIKNNLTSRHFPINPANAVAPEGVEYAPLVNVVEKEQEKVEDPYEYKEGYMISNRGDSISGKFIFDFRRSKQIDFRNGGTVKFAYTDDGKDIKKTLDPETFRRFSFDNTIYESHRFLHSISANDAMNPPTEIMEVLYRSDKVEVYKYHPYVTEESRPKRILAIKRADQKKIKSLNGVKYLNWKKAFSKYFGECPDLSAAILAGEYPKNDANVVKAAEIYTNSCK